jgi:hypothetical protein
MMGTHHKPDRQATKGTLSGSPKTQNDRGDQQGCAAPWNVRALSELRAGRAGASRGYQTVQRVAGFIAVAGLHWNAAAKPG